MAIVKLLAKNFPLKVNSGTPESPSWTSVGGINSLTISTSKGTVDTRDYDSGSWLEHMVVNRGVTLSLDGQRKQDPDDGSRDPGQEEVESIAWETGADAEGEFQITVPGGDPYQFKATVNVTPFGGSTDDLATWDVELEVTGPFVQATAGDGDGDGDA